MSLIRTARLTRIVGEGGRFMRLTREPAANKTKNRVIRPGFFKLSEGWSDRRSSARLCFRRGRLLLLDRPLQLERARRQQRSVGLEQIGVETAIVVDQRAGARCGRAHR